MNAVVIDIELADDPNVIGWGNTLNGHCPVACAVAYFTATDTFRLYDGDRAGLSRMMQDCRGWLVCGHAIDTFDMRVIHSILGTDLAVWRTFDLLAAIVAQTRKNAGWSLDAIASAILPGIPAKLHDSAQIPAMWKAGRRTEVYSHCLHDVRRTAQVLTRIVTRGGLVTNGAATVRVDVSPIAKAFRQYAIREARYENHVSGRPEPSEPREHSSAGG